MLAKKTKKLYQKLSLQAVPVRTPVIVNAFKLKLIILDGKKNFSVEARMRGQIDQSRWKSTDDPGYQRMYALVQDAIKPLPYKDVAGTCGRDKGCLCRSCWVRKLKEEREKLITGKP